MATNIPPHNLREAIDAVIAYIDDPTIDTVGLMQHIKGPDFPTGGIIVGRQGIKDAYETGRGRVIVRARAHIEPLRQGKEAIIVTEMPYQVSKGDGRNDGSGLIRKIADVAQEKRVAGISDLRDESDRSGTRVVIELKRDAIPRVVLNNLYKHTSMQTTFGVNAVALWDGVPRTLSLRQMIQAYVDHQREVVVRRTKHELREKEARLHVVEGLLVALDDLDAVIELIRGSRDPDAARDGLMAQFGLSRIQAQAILDLRLQRLTALEADKLRQEHAELVERIEELREILGDEARVSGLIKEELLEVKDAYGDERRTEITHSESDIDVEDLIADQQMVISITRSGYIKSLPLATYRQQKRGGRGVMGMEMKEDDYIEHLFISSTHDYLLFFTNRGKVYRQKVYDLPEASRTARGRALVNLLPLKEGEFVRAVLATRDYAEERYLVFATKHGIVKKTEFAAYNTPHGGRRDHRGEHPRRRRARGRAPHLGRRRHHHGLALRPGHPLRRGPGAGDGARHERRARHERLARGQRGARHGHRPRRRRAARGHRERLRQAHLPRRLSAEGPRRHGRPDHQAHRAQGRARRAR